MVTFLDHVLQIFLYSHFSVPFLLKFCRTAVIHRLLHRDFDSIMVLIKQQL